MRSFAPQPSAAQVCHSGGSPGVASAVPPHSLLVLQAGPARPARATAVLLPRCTRALTLALSAMLLLPWLLRLPVPSGSGGPCSGTLSSLRPPWHAAPFLASPAGVVAAVRTGSAAPLRPAGGRHSRRGCAHHLAAQA